MRFFTKVIPPIDMTINVLMTSKFLPLEMTKSLFHMTKHIVEKRRNLLKGAFAAFERLTLKEIYHVISYFGGYIHDNYRGLSLFNSSLIYCS